MTEKTRAELKAYFETNDMPTQAQFSELIDSVPNFIDNELLKGSQLAIVAHAGGGQASATALTKLANTIQTCASDHDSVKLPVSTGGTIICLWNATAKILDVYPQTGGFILLNGVNNPQTIAAFKCAVFMSGTTNGWAGIIG